jgi:Thioredoxin
MSNNYSYKNIGQTSTKKMLPWIIGGLILAILLIGGFLFAQSAITKNTTSDFGTLTASYIRSYNYKYGLKDAPVKFVYMYDFSCASCQANTENLQGIIDKYQDRVEFVFKNYVAAHPGDGNRNAKASMAAGLQGKYFEFYKKLISITKAQGNGLVAESKYAEIAVELGMDKDKFVKDYNSLPIEEKEKQENKDVKDAVVDPSEYAVGTPKPSGTPAVAIVKNDKVVTWWTGILSVDEASVRIDKVLQ